MKWRKKVVCLVVVAVAIAAGGGAVLGQVAPKALVAVLELDVRTRRLTIENAQYLTDAVRKAASDALDTKRFWVMTRESMDVIVPPEERRCMNNLCYAAIGKRLQAQYVIGGNLVDVGGLIGITLEAYDKDGGLLGSEQGEAKDLPEALALVRRLAPQLLGRIAPPGGGGAVPPGVVGGGRVEHGVAIDRGEKIVNKVTDETGFLVIRSEPPGAIVTLNGKEVGRTPLQLEQMVGRYVVVAELGRLYHPAREELTLTREGAKVTLILRPAFGTLEVRSSPAGAEVWVDDVVVGKTPYRNDRQPSGTYKVRVEAADHVPETLEVTVSDGQVVSRDVSLAPDYGSLVVRSDPPGAAIAMDDQPTGEVTPATFPVVKPGVHVLRLTKEAHGDAVERASVKRGETTTVSATLTPRLGLLKVTAAFEDATPCEGPVTIDGREVGTAPWKGEVLATRHDVGVTCGGRVARQTVTVGHNETQAIALTVRGGTASPVAVMPHPPRPSVEVRVPKEPEEQRHVALSLSFIEGFVWYEGQARRTHVGMEASLSLRFLDWIRPGLGLGWTVESPVNVTVRPGIQWYIGPVFLRTSLAAMLTPVRAIGFAAGLGGDIPLWRDGFLSLEASGTVWSKAVIPVEFRLGVGHAF